MRSEDARKRAIKGTLPEQTTVEGGMDLYGTPIKSLPKDLVIEGSLNLMNTDLTSLPKGLIVGGPLHGRAICATTYCTIAVGAITNSILIIGFVNL